MDKTGITCGFFERDVVTALDKTFVMTVWSF